MFLGVFDGLLWGCLAIHHRLSSLCHKWLCQWGCHASFSFRLWWWTLHPHAANSCNVQSNELPHIPKLQLLQCSAYKHWHLVCVYNMQFLNCKTSPNIQFTLGQKSTIYPKIHVLKLWFFTKFTIPKSHFWQNSQFQNLIFHKIHIFQTSNSKEFSDKKLGFAPVCSVSSIPKLS